MATRGQVELARIRSRPIHEQARQSMAEFNDPFTTAVDLGTNLLEGYKFGQKLIDKKDSLLDREARKTERGDTNEMFKDYDEYKNYVAEDEFIIDAEIDQSLKVLVQLLSIES